MVMEKLDRIEQVSNNDQIIDLAPGEENIAEVGAASLFAEVKGLENIAHLYFSDASGTPLLDAEQERQLGSLVEEGEYLIKLEKEWVNYHGTRPSAVNVLLLLGEHLGRVDALFEMVCRHLGLKSEGPIREQHIIELRFGLQDGRNRVLSEVGAEFGVTRERIRQIERRALNKLRHPRLSRKLIDYL